MATKALIFDFDGLILDTEWPAYQSWREAYAAHGCQFSLEMWSKVLGGRGDEWDHIAYLSAATGRKLDGEAVRRERLARKLALIDEEAILPGVFEYPHEGKNLGLQIALVSSSGSEWVERYLSKLRLSERFNPVVCAGDVERVKPQPDLYLVALERLGVGASEAIAFEDSPNGVQAAKAAGIYCVAVPNRASALLPMPDTDLVIASLADVPLARIIAGIS